MSWQVALRPEIRADLANACRWYDRERAGLGGEFVAEVLKVFESLAEHAQRNARRSRKQDVRWALARRFPYRIIYQLREQEEVVLVVAVLHSARHDRHWQRRL